MKSRGGTPYIGKTADGTGMSPLPREVEGLSHLDGDETETAAGEGQLNAHTRMPGGMGDISGNRTRAPFGTTPFYEGGEEGGKGRGGSGAMPMGRQVRGKK